jgi:hypothetical protein
MDTKRKLERRRWLNQKDGNLPRRKSVDRGFISLQSPQAIGATDEQASHDDLTRTASLEQGSGSHRLDQEQIREDPMREAFLRGFLDELEKSAKAKPNFLEKGEEIVRNIGRGGAAGAAKGEGTGGKVWGAVKGGYKGVKKSFKKYPGMFIGPAAAYAGYELLKAVKGKDKDEERR